MRSFLPGARPPAPPPSVLVVLALLPPVAGAAPAAPSLSPSAPPSRPPSPAPSAPPLSPGPPPAPSLAPSAVPSPDPVPSLAPTEAPQEKNSTQSDGTKGESFHGAGIGISAALAICCTALGAAAATHGRLWGLSPEQVIQARIRALAAEESGLDVAQAITSPGAQPLRAGASDTSHRDFGALNNHQLIAVSEMERLRLLTLPLLGHREADDDDASRPRCRVCTLPLDGGICPKGHSQELQGKAAKAAAAAAAAAAEALSEAGEGTRSPIVASLEPAAGAPGPEPQQQQGACSPAEGELSTTQRQPAPAPAALRRPSPDPSTSPHSAELNASNASHRRTLLGKTQSPGSHQQQQQEADGGSSAPDAVEPPSSECGPMWQPVSGLASESQSEAHACALAAESAGGGRSHPSDSGAVPLSVAALRELQGQLQALSPRPPAGRIARWLGELSAPHSGPADGPAALGESWAGISELRGGTPLHSQLSGSEDGEEDSTSDGSGTRSGTGRVGTEGADCSQRIITMIDLSHDAVEQCRPPGVLESRSERQSSGARRSRRSRDTPASSSRLSWQQPKAGSPLAAMVATARLVEGW
eukprot:TRINITY_DN2145_c0_g2_i2.p1 TRINITY_DN2145_c0_g2~~TRINITY_DN2145_c0_g2_i2.p1  ORF type:complete len:588 (+),score=91.33 TRINITY_DN2145_c0_g2_i2:81-1844(+)